MKLTLITRPGTIGRKKRGLDSLHYVSLACAGSVNSAKVSNIVIERVQGVYRGRNKSSTYKDLVWTVATSSDTSLDISGQTKLTLETIQENLIELCSDKSKIVSAQVYISDMGLKSEMDAIWCDWIGADQSNWPQRACLGVSLEGDVLIEVTVTAVRA